jgi:hypothetical protein
LILLLNYADKFLFSIILCFENCSLKHLDLRRVSEEEKSLARDNLSEYLRVVVVFCSISNIWGLFLCNFDV